MPEFTDATREAIIEAADTIANPDGYSEDTAESERRSGLRDELEHAMLNACQRVLEDHDVV